MKMKFLSITTAILICFLITSTLSWKKLQTELMSALKILKLTRQNFIGKMLFIYESEIDKRSDYKLNGLDYKMIHITNTQLIIYSTPNQYEKNVKSDEENLNISNYLMSIKLRDIDLPCNDYLYLCTLGEFKREYEKKMPDVNFDVNYKVLNRIGDFTKAEKNCLILTFGPFTKIQNLPYLCFDNLDHLVYVQNLLTERIFKENSDHYSASVGLLNNDRNGLLYGQIDLDVNKITFKYQNKIIEIHYSQINSYALTIYMHEDIPWNGPAIRKPDSSRCFRIKLNSGEILYFFIYFAKNDYLYKHVLTNSNSIFVIDLLVARINLKLHNYNLKLSQTELKSTKELDCEMKIMEPIKYEIRLKYIIIRHKVRQLISINKIKMEEGMNILEQTKEKIINSSCDSSSICMYTSKKCINNGLLPLKIKGYKVATTLKNPFISTIPKSVLKSEETKKLLSNEFLSSAKNLLGIYNKNNIKKINLSDILLLETDSSINNPEVPSSLDIKKAFNTFNFILNDRKQNIDRLEQSIRYCVWMTRGSLNNLKRKVNYLLFASVNEPFFEYLGTLRDKMLTTKK